tara:strand:- start:36 stop:797 length:762 start_codon:yes stop_codon:yes gene_type:complete
VTCDESNITEKNIFFDGWIKHKILSETYIFTDSSNTEEIFYNWDGNSFYLDIDGIYEGAVELNEYGFPIRTAYEMDGERYYIRFDKWKVTENGWIDSSGDTVEAYTYTWEGLTQTKTGCEYDNCTDLGSYIEYNAFGKELTKYSSTGILLMNKEYLNDSRRLLNWYNYTDNGEISTHWKYSVWNDYDFIALLYTPLNGDATIPERKIEGRIDQYYNVVEETHFFDSEKSGYLNPNVSIIISYDYNSPFEQIYP